MLSYLRQSWETGREGNLIEEMIRIAFRDFAPYAGADRQQLRCLRRQSDGTTAALHYEEDGEWSVHVTNPHVGTMAFATTREFLFDLRARIPLPCGRWENDRCGTGGGNTTVNNDTNNLTQNNNNKNNSNINESGNNSINGRYGATELIRESSSEKNIMHHRRFFSSAAMQPSYHIPGTIGVLELLSSSSSKRHGVGLRLGPFLLRATTLPYVNPTTRNASDASKGSDNTSGMYALYRSPFVIDAAWCTSVQSILPASLATMLPASCYLSTAVQHPVGATGGDTLAAVSFRHMPPNRRNGVNNGISDNYRDLLNEYDDFHLLVVQTLISTGISHNALDNTTMSRTSLLARDSSWRDLGTLIGVSKSFRDGLLRVSASTLFHDRDIDYEAAVTLNAVSFLGNPTLFKVGLNGMGRVGVSIATQLFDSLIVTLGIHHTPGATTRFGLEIAV